MSKEDTRTVRDFGGRVMYQRRVRCAHHGCPAFVWVTIGMPGHPCCESCCPFEEVEGKRDT